MTDENLTPQQELAIRSLVAGRSKTRAAKIANVDRSTIFRWLKDENFCSQLVSEQNEVFELLRAQLLSVSLKAIKTLEKNLTSKSDAVQVRSSLGIVKLALNARDAPLLNRMVRVERILDRRKENLKQAFAFYEEMTVESPDMAEDEKLLIIQSEFGVTPEEIASFADDDYTDEESVLNFDG